MLASGWAEAANAVIVVPANTDATMIRSGSQSMIDFLAVPKQCVHLVGACSATFGAPWSPRLPLSLTASARPSSVPCSILGQAPSLCAIARRPPALELNERVAHDEVVGFSRARARVASVGVKGFRGEKVSLDTVRSALALSASHDHAVRYANWSAVAEADVLLRCGIP